MFVIVINSRTFIIVHLVIFSKSISTHFKWSNSSVNLTLKQYFPSILHITPTQRQPGSTILVDYIYKYLSKPPNAMPVFSLNIYSVLGIVFWISITEEVSFHLTLLSTHFHLSILLILLFFYFGCISIHCYDTNVHAIHSFVMLCTMITFPFLIELIFLNLKKYLFFFWLGFLFYC